MTPRRRSSSVERRELHERAALLERRGELQVFELQPDFGADELRERARMQARRIEHVAGDHLRRSLHVVQRYAHGAVTDRYGGRAQRERVEAPHDNGRPREGQRTRVPHRAATSGSTTERT